MIGRVWEVKAFVEVRVTFPGMHRWPDAPDGVRWLRDPHHHEFHVVARVMAAHDDRAIETLTLADGIREFIGRTWTLKCAPAGPRFHDLGTLSCEQIARAILDHFDCEEVTVLEDGQHGGGVVRVYQPGTARPVQA